MVGPTSATAVKVLLFSFGSTCYALLGILSQLSKSEDGSYAYSLPTVVLVAEAVKLMLSWVKLAREKGSFLLAWKAVMYSPISKWTAFAVPSVLYSVNNNLDMLNNQHMDPATEQVLVQCKILTTGIVWWLVFRKPLGLRKWFSLVLLFLGAILAAMPSEAMLSGSRHMFINTTGMVLVTVYVWVSASAGVYNEWLYKFVGKDESFDMCNIRLYSIGVLFNLGAHLLHERSAGRPLLDSLRPGNFFAGYNRYVWGLVLTYSLMGLVLAGVMKWFDNIVKLFISGSSMYVSAVLSWVIFGYAPTFHFVAALVLMTMAMLMHNWEKIALFGGKKAD